MATDARAAEAFYATPRGAMAARLLRELLARLWPAVAGHSILGLGYASPYLRLWHERAQRCIALTPAQVGAARWPAGDGPNLSCSGLESALPFPDLCFDRILVVHGLEAAEQDRRLLREVWRVLKDDGHLMVVAPNRRGVWAYVESTPFGQGQPYSTGQIDDLLAASLFRVERREGALFVPPVHYRPALRSAALWENSARRLLPPGVAGLTLSEAVKDMYAALPVEAAQRHATFAEAA